MNSYRHTRRLEREKLAAQELEEVEFKDRMSKVVQMELISFKAIIETIIEKGDDKKEQEFVSRMVKSLNGHREYALMPVGTRIKIFDMHVLRDIETAYYFCDIFLQQIGHVYDVYFKSESTKKSYETLKNFSENVLPFIQDGLKVIPE